MESLKSRIDRKQDELKSLKKNFDDVMSKLKKDAKSFDCKSMKEVSRRAMCFYFGEHIEYYKNLVFKRHWELSISQTWTQESKFVNDGFYNIHYYSNNNRYEHRHGSLVGFVCELKDTVKAIGEYNFLKLWNWYCIEKKYKDSFYNFKKLCESKQIDIIELYTKYLEDKRDYNFILEVINEPSIKLKNIVICIRDIDNNINY